MKKKEFNWKLYTPKCTVCGSEDIEEVWINFEDGRYSKHIEICKKCGSMLSTTFDNEES